MQGVVTSCTMDCMAHKEVTTAHGDSLDSLARAHGIDDWHLLWEMNKGVVKNPDLLEAGTKIKIPEHDQFEKGRKELGERGYDARAYFGGRWYLSPLEVVSVTVLDPDEKPIKAGTPYKIVDAHGKVVSEGKLDDDGLFDELPRGLKYFLHIDGKNLGAVR